MRSLQDLLNMYIFCYITTFDLVKAIFLFIHYDFRCDVLYAILLFDKDSQSGILIWRAY